MEADELIKTVVDMLNHEIKILTTKKSTLKSQLTIELNVTQGGIGDVYITSQRRAKVK